MDLIATEVMRRTVRVDAGMSLPELEHAFIQAGHSGFPVIAASE
jgi:hypothetical protein